ncbi:hypothetical protein NUW54_g6905 [Trametes sanguinea]|uniref:Uncharacterized protein n=1 Tax=Trametes sanguinea TaxID=158606 RepID=A0ACC1PQY0_9APHY|nr:hypothetical protein NUW54_g6905 [Trametes sanguinea]
MPYTDLPPRRSSLARRSEDANAGIADATRAYEEPPSSAMVASPRDAAVIVPPLEAHSDQRGESGAQWNMPDYGPDTTPRMVPRVAYASAPPTRNFVLPHRICRKPLRHLLLLHSILSLITRKPSVSCSGAADGCFHRLRRGIGAHGHCAAMLTLGAMDMSFNCGSSWPKLRRVRAGHGRQGANMPFASGLYQAPDVTPARVVQYRHHGGRQERLLASRHDRRQRRLGLTCGARRPPSTPTGIRLHTTTDLSLLTTLPPRRTPAAELVVLSLCAS